MSESPVSEAGKIPGNPASDALGQRTVHDLLSTVVDVAATAIHELGAASISAAAASGYQTLTASHDTARSLDEVQYSSGDGPCLEAIATGREVVAELPSERWVPFSTAAAAAGFAAVWSLPLVVEDSPAGSLNLYFQTGRPADGETARTARLVAGQSAAVLTNARELARCEYTNLTLRQALETRTVIGQAQGVLMARQNIGPDDAFDILRRASQRTNRKLREIAAEIVASVQGPPAEEE